MKIVVLDGRTLNPGDLSFDALGEVAPCKVHGSTPPDRVVARSRGAAILIVNKIDMDRSTIADLPTLKYIGVTATGYNCVDLSATSERGIVVTNVPTYGTRSVAQMVFAHVLEFCHNVGRHAEGVRAGKWCKAADFCYWDYPLVELAGMTMGIVGVGKIGRATGELAKAFAMEVIAHDPHAPSANFGDFQAVSLDDLLARADVVSLHCPLTDESFGMIDASALAKMKTTALLVNTAHGPLINEPDLADALNAGRIAGAALDVLSVEPPHQSNPLLTAANCTITPHIAWATRSARARLMQTVADNVKAFLAGAPINVVG